MFEIYHYLTRLGVDVYESWFENLTDRKAKLRIAARLDRVEQGNIGDCKPVGDGVWELRIGHGPGYRIYYALAGKQIVLLLCAGDKRRQSSEIQVAINYWANYQVREMEK